MKNLKRKKIEIIFFALITSVVVFSVKSTEFTINNQKVEPTTATPVSEKKVILDAGHGGEDRTELFQVMELKNLI